MAQANPAPAQTPVKKKKKKIPWKTIVTAAAVATALYVGGLYVGRGKAAPTYNQVNKIAAEQVENYSGNNYSQQDKRKITTEVTETVEQTIGNNYELGGHDHPGYHGHGHHHGGRHSRADKPGDASGI